MSQAPANRRIRITPQVPPDPVLEEFLQSLDQGADVDAYLHRSPPVITPCTEIQPVPHRMGDGRTAHVFHMGRAAAAPRHYIVVVTSVNAKLRGMSA